MDINEYHLFSAPQRIPILSIYKIITNDNYYY